MYTVVITDSSLLLDLTSSQTNRPSTAPGKTPKYKTYKGKVVVRDASKITGIVIHQTACFYSHGISESSERNMVRWKRALGTPYHVLAFLDRPVIANPLLWYTYHGNGFNAFSLSLSLEGLYAGNGKDTTELSESLLVSARTGLEYLVTAGRKLGMPLEYVWAHRQSNPTKRGDPGREAWQHLVLDYATKNLDLKTDPTKVIQMKKGIGLPIPRSWDLKNGVGPY